MGWSWKSPEHDETAVASRVAVGGLFLLVLIPQFVIEMPLLVAVLRYFRPEPRILFSLMFGPLMGLNLKLADWIVDRILEWHGLVRYRKTVETWHRAVPETAPGHADEGSVRVRVKPWIPLVLGLLSLGLSVACTAFLLQGVDNEGFWHAVFAGVMLFALCSACCFYGYVFDIDQAWADASGIAGHNLRGSRFRSSLIRIPWSSIDSCDIETRRDVRGRPYAQLLTLKDPAGKHLLTMGFGNLTETTAPLIEAIKARLPRRDPGLENW